MMIPNLYIGNGCFTISIHFLMVVWGSRQRKTFLFFCFAPSDTSSVSFLTMTLNWSKSCQKQLCQKFMEKSNQPMKIIQQNSNTCSFIKKKRFCIIIYIYIFCKKKRVFQSTLCEFATPTGAVLNGYRVRTSESLDLRDELIQS